MTSNHEIAATPERICRGKIKLLHYKFVGVDFLLSRAADIVKRVPPNSRVAAGYNILTKYPGFVKTGPEYDLEITQLLNAAKQVI